ncbi:MAG: hypothetical protein M0R39_03750 [Prolixibacteraceae bacterium]|nr:hypothetical protein [Prolixibacteraceae bacterium]
MLLRQPADRNDGSFFGGEGGEKEAGHQFSAIAESPPASFSPPSQNPQPTVIARRHDEAIC